MANIFEHKDRHVVPNWRSFRKTALLGELNSLKVASSLDKLHISIDDYIIDYEKNRTIIHAADLLSAAIVNAQQDNSTVRNAANFILSSTDKATRSQISLANKTLDKESSGDLSSNFAEIGVSSLELLANPEPFYRKIRETKRRLRNYPRNAILYIELSRYYSILGNEQKSTMAMRTALQLAPYNRFVLRCATRFFAHYKTENNNYLEYIHSKLINNPMTKVDPWLTAAEISISTMRGKNSRLIKSGIALIKSGNVSPFNFTELAGSIGTVEMLNGRVRKSRDYFNRSLIDPNDNSLAQIEWASKKDSRLGVRQADFKVFLNYEALALENYYEAEYDQSLDNTVRWLKDQPFSKRPVLFGSNVACSLMKDQEKAIRFLNAGLVSHPNDPQLINNVAYSYALSGKPEEALLSLDKIRNEQTIDTSTKICLKATEGLVYFRKGNPDVGRRLYLEAIENTKAEKMQNLNWIAVLNYAREELLLKSEYAEPVMHSVSLIPKVKDNIEIEILRNDVNELYMRLHS